MQAVPDAESMRSIVGDINPGFYRLRERILRASHAFETSPSSCARVINTSSRDGFARPEGQAQRGAVSGRRQTRKTLLIRYVGVSMGTCSKDLMYSVIGPVAVGAFIHIDTASSAAPIELSWRQSSDSHLLLFAKNDTERLSRILWIPSNYSITPCLVYLAEIESPSRKLR